MVFDEQKSKPGMRRKAKRAYIAIVSYIKDTTITMFRELVLITEGLFVRVKNMISRMSENHGKAMLLSLVTGSITTIGGLCLFGATLPVTAGCATVVATGTLVAGKYVRRNDANRV